MDERIRRAVFPVAVYEKSGAFENADRLTQPCDLQIGLSESHIITVRGKGYAVLDFGREMHGSVRILLHTCEGGAAKIRIRTGESVSECYAEPGEKNAGNHHTLRDISAELVNFSDMEFLQTGFRYVRVDFPEEKTYYIKAILATSVGRDLHPVGSFTCNDGRVNEIFEVASRTLELNMQTYIWDGIKRDRLVWIGDIHPESLGISCLFGSHEIVEKSLDYLVEHTPLPEWMNAIPSYTAWWVVILHDTYLQTGNLEFLKKHKDYVDGAIRLLESAVSENGTVGVDALFDWPSHNSADEKIGVYALWTLAAKCGELLFRELGLDVSFCRAFVQKLLRNQQRTVVSHKQCEAFLVYSGLKNAKDSYGFLVKNGAHGFSTFMSYYLLSAVARVDVAHALQLMKEYYGGMLDMGATSFWEDFDLDWMKGSAPITRLPKAGEHDIHGDFGDHCYVGFRHSLCHGWSCGPIAFLMRAVAGIEILAPGCKKMRIKPVAAGLESYEIKYPTPFGVIAITLKDGKIRTEVPKGIEVVA